MRHLKFQFLRLIGERLMLSATSILLYGYLGFGQNFNTKQFYAGVMGELDNVSRPKHMQCHINVCYITSYRSLRKIVERGRMNVMNRT